ncbi:hypothetical protein AYL99_11658 [Fonsecaea erecta]|uniref:Uncharacterized protein n=1 Tax=Fonsecaea erecta TaxID=1367422 RepID=A0A178Z4K5_9EURO|nr:hypothetical protein AYL99_11658 [Fonsecaea erecta]OAP54123.1 hypothetical protein AYL99_11658 [Fonsecaea erecta]
MTVGSSSMKDHARHKAKHNPFWVSTPPSTLVQSHNPHDSDQPGPLRRLFLSEYPGARSPINGSLSAYKTAHSYTPGAEWIEKRAEVKIYPGRSGQLFAYRRDGGQYRVLKVVCAGLMTVSGKPFRTSKLSSNSGTKASLPVRQPHTMSVANVTQTHEERRQAALTARIAALKGGVLQTLKHVVGIVTNYAGGDAHYG